MRLKRALNLITIRRAALPRKLEVAHAAGYSGVGLWVDELDHLANAGGDVREVAARLRERGLAAAELCFVGGWMYPAPEQRGQVRERARHALQMAQELGCDCAVACAATHSGDLTDAARDFADLCELARGFGVRVALEFLGGAEQVKDVQTAWEVVDMAGAANGGLLIDTFHFFKGGSQVEDLEGIPGPRVFLVHINDCPEMPREELQDRDRIFPGEGVVPLESIVASLVEKGYRGYLSLELFNEDYWAADPYLIAQEGMRSFERAGV